MSTNGMAVPSFTFDNTEIESLKQNGTPKKVNLNDTARISSIPKNESTYTKNLNTLIRKGGSNTFTYVNSATYNYNGSSLNNITKYTTNMSSKSANSL